MAERDYIGRLLQILRIKSPVDSVSGDDIISVETKMQYSALFPIINDGDIIYKAYVDSIVNKTTIIKSQANLIEDGAGTGNYYLKYTDAGGLAVAAGIRPYSINSVQGAHEYGIPAILENDTTWDFPRIYGFNNAAQTITIYAI